MKTILLTITILLSVSIFANPINLEIGERDRKSTISFEAEGRPYAYVKNEGEEKMIKAHGGIELGINYSRFLTKDIQVEIGGGVFFNGVYAILGTKYHFYINKNLTTYIELKIAPIYGLAAPTNGITLGEPLFNILTSSLIGLRYETNSGFTASLGVGITIFPAHEEESFTTIQKPTSFYPHGGIKLGYSF